MLVSDLLETLLGLPYTSLSVYDILVLLSQIGEYILSKGIALSSTDPGIYSSIWIIIGVIRRASYLIQETSIKRSSALFTSSNTTTESTSVPTTPTPTLFSKQSQTNTGGGQYNKNDNSTVTNPNTIILDTLRNRLHDLIEKEKQTIPSLSLSNNTETPLPTSTEFFSSLSLRSLFFDSSPSSIALYTRFTSIPWNKALASSILDGISELAGECANVSTSLNETIIDQIRPGESILLIGGYSRTILNYIQEASKKRMFEIFICEGNHIHGLRGQDMAIQITTPPTDSANTKMIIPSTVLIAESTVYSILPRISKVFVSTSAIFGNTGDCICTSGTLGIILAAYQAAKPILVLNSIMKLLPIDFTSLPGYTNQGNKQNVLSFLQYNELVTENISDIDIYLPLWDHIPSKYISYYITSLGVIPPQQISRISNELYGTHY